MDGNEIGTVTMTDSKGNTWVPLAGMKVYTVVFEQDHASENIEGVFSSLDSAIKFCADQGYTHIYEREPDWLNRRCWQMLDNPQRPKGGVYSFPQLGLEIVEHELDGRPRDTLESEAK